MPTATATAIRQQLLVLYLASPALESAIVAWSSYDGASDTVPGTGEEEMPPYPAVVDAMRDGWRVLQMFQPRPSLGTHGFETGLLPYQVVLERLVEQGDRHG